MKTFALAAALTVLAGSAFAQEAPYRVIDGEIVYGGQTMATMASGTSFQGQASAAVPAPFMLDGGNINWDQNYSGK